MSPYPRRTPVFVSCERCGGEFQKLRKAGRFCSKRCSGFSQVRQRSDLATRVWAKVDMTGECWVWTAADDGRGYGQIRINGVTKKATRVVWEMTHGPIGPGLEICHRCDNPPCVRPEHLFLGSHADNMRDASAKGHIWAPGKSLDVRGAKNANAKLNDDLVRTIRRMRDGGVRNYVIAEALGVHPVVASAVGRRKTWRHVSEEAPALRAELALVSR